MASAPAWVQALQHAINLNRSARHVKHVQLATVRPDGSPACRTIVFRSFSNDHRLLFCTDSRSNKAAEEYGHERRAEVCWYLTVSREQFRLKGSLDLVGADCSDLLKQEERLKVWKGMSEVAREQFGWPHPGLPRAASERLYSGPSLDQDSLPLDTFCLLSLLVEEVDHLQLKANRRFKYERQRGENANEQTWSKVEVNP